MHPKEPRLHPARGMTGILTEAAMIVLSILLALGLENWNEHRKEEKRCREALHLIRDEIVQNREEMSKLIDGHRAKAAELMHAAEGISRGGNVSVQANAQFATHNSTAFEVAVNSRVLNSLEYRTLLALAESYAAHKWLTNLEESYFQMVLGVNREEKRKGIAMQLRLSAGILGNYADLEKETVEQYDSAVAAINRTLAE
ncbi:MAG: hypothetical protein QUS35_04555 [bacterium]|nr:hypothetical protein [bacterium]